MSKIYVGQYPLLINLSVSVGTAGGAFQIRAARPDGTVVTWPATITSANQISYTTQSGDLNIPGVWALQAIQVDANGVAVNEPGDSASLVVTPLGQ